MPNEVELQLALFMELKTVRQFGLDKLDELDSRTGKPKVGPTTELERAAQQIPGYTNKLTRSAVVELLLMHEIPLIKTNPCREWLPLSFGLTEDTRGKDSKQRRNAAFRLSDSSSSNTFGRSDGGDEFKAIGVLAAQIVADCLQGMERETAAEPEPHIGNQIGGAEPTTPLTELQAVPTSSMHVELPTPDDLLAHQPAYVRRDEYHASFEAMISLRRTIVLAGGRGNGKSRLALEIVAEKHSDTSNFVYIFAESVASTVLDIKANLLARGKPVEKMSSIEQLSPLFLDLLCSSDAPEWVVFDNIEDPEMLGKLLPSAGTRSKIIVTSSVALPRYVSGTIEVLPMQDEAVRLVQQELPDASTAEAQLIARTLGGQPLPIVQICSFILADNIVGIDDFIADLISDRVAALDAPAPFVENTLVALYRKILASLQTGDARSQLAATLLESCSCMAPERIPRELLRDAIRTNTSVSTTELQGAVLLLESRFLVRRVGSQLAMHPFTHFMLRGMLSNEVKRDISVRLFLVLGRLLAPYSAEAGLPADMLQLMHHARYVLLDLKNIDEDKHQQLNLHRTLAVLMRGFRQLGDDLGASVVAEVLESITDFTDAESVTSMSEAYFEWLEHRYALGLVSSVERLKFIRALLGIKGGGLDTTKLAPSDVVMLAEALIEDGRCLEASELLTTHESAFSLASPERAAPIEQCAHAHLIYGDLLTNIGEWRTAFTWLERSFDEFSQSPDSQYVTRGKLRVLEAMLAGMIKGRASGEAFRWVFSRLGQIVTMKNWAATDSVIVRAYAESIAGRYDATRLLYSSWDTIKRTGKWEPKKDLPLSELTACLERLTLARDLYVTAGDRRKADEAYFSAFAVTLLAGSLQPLHVLEMTIAGHLMQVNERAQNMLFVFASKVLIINGPPPTISQHANLLETYAELFASSNNDPYWYCEALATACAMATIRGSVKASWLKSLYEGYADIGRLDRWRAVERALSHLPNDYASFSREFSYLLTW